MSILARCPFCEHGKIRAPESAVGQSATCPKCGNCFTIVKSEGKAEPRTKGTPSVPRESAPAARATSTIKPTLARDTDDEFLERVAAEETPPERPLASILADAPTLPSPSPIAFTPPPTPDHSWPWALAGLGIGSLGMAVSQFVPAYGRLLILGLGGVGLGVALVGLLRQGKLRWPLGAAAINAVALLLVVALPSWLNLGTWLPEKAVDDSREIKAVGRQGEIRTASTTEWIDVTQGNWQRDDVRVAMGTMVVAPVELAGPNQQKRTTREKYLQIKLKIANVGVARPIPVQAWSSPLPMNSLPIRLVDSTGHPLALKSFESGWEVPGRNKPTSIFPGKSFDDVLIFEPPLKTVEYLRLELPASVFGGEDYVRLHLPQTVGGPSRTP